MRMKFQKLMIVFFTITILVSCSKSTITPASQDTITAKTMLDVAYGTDVAQKMDIYLPANRNIGSTKVMVLIHGGSWIAGDKSDFNTMIDSLKNRLPNYAFFNLNYRLAAVPSTNIFPTQSTDIKAAVAFIDGNTASYLVSKKFVITGASAGGQLAMLQGFKDSVPVKAKAIVSFFGPSDMVDMYNNPASASAPAAGIALLLNGTPSTNPTLYYQNSPINFINSASAPTILLHGGLDLMVRPSHSLQVYNKLLSVNRATQYVYYPTADHGNWSTATYTDAFNNIQTFLNANVQ